MKGVIYAVIGDCGMPRYVGQTTLPPEQRLQLLRSAAKKGTRPVDEWLRSGEAVAIVALEHDPDDLDEAERRWIRTMREAGFALLNIYDGGRRAPTGYQHTPETRERLSEAHGGKTLSGEHRQKLSEAHRGKPLSNEHRAAIGRGGKGLKRSPETRARMAAAKLGDLNPMSAKRRAERKGVMPS